MINKFNKFLFVSYFLLFAPSENEIPLNLSPESNITPSIPNIGGLLLKTFSSLIIILILSYLAVKLLKSKYLRWDSDKEWIQLLDYQPLGQNRGIYIAKIMDKYCLLSVTEGQISILKEFDKLEENIILRDNNKPYDFSQDINVFFNRFRRNNNEAMDVNDFNKQLQEKIRRTKDLYKD